MSLKELESAIKNQPDPVTGALGYVFDGDQIEEWIKRIEVKFDAFKKQLEERFDYYEGLMVAYAVGDYSETPEHLIGELKKELLEK